MRRHRAPVVRSIGGCCFRSVGTPPRRNWLLATGYQGVVRDERSSSQEQHQHQHQQHDERNPTPADVQVESDRHTTTYVDLDMLVDSLDDSDIEFILSHQF